MTADIVQIRDFQLKRDITKAEADLNRQAIEIANIAFPSVLSGSGCAMIDGMSPEQLESWTDTSNCNAGSGPSQANAFHSEKDPA